MTRRFLPKATLLAATALCSTSIVTGPAFADSTTSQIGSIEKQIRALEGQLNHMKRDLNARNDEVKAARSEAATASRQAREAEERMGPMRYDVNGRPMAPQPLSAPPGYGYAGASGSPYMNVGGYPSYVPSGPKLKQGQFQLGGVRVTLGGFIEAAGIYRSRNEAADISSSFNTGIPYPQSANYHQDEFRGTARQSRISLMVEGNPNDHTTLTAYYETDFNSSGITSNSTESNSYTLRARQLFAQYYRSDDDFYVLGGQAWSLLTMSKMGEAGRSEDLPSTIDAQYVPGFVWTRNVGLRVVKGFDHDKFDIGLSVESPESSYSQAATSLKGATINTTNIGLSSNGATLNSTANYSTEYAPDVIAKVTADPGWGHYEIFGVARFLHDRVSYVGSGASHTDVAGGGGAGLTLPLIPKRLDLRGSVLIGDGIGRYGSAQLADATIARDGSPKPLPEVLALAGLTFHATKALDLYSYFGTEQVRSRESYSVGKTNYGYGNPLYSNAGCETELSTGTCTANTKGIYQATGGLWWKFLKGDYGTMQTGVQYSYTHKTIFEGVGGKPSTNEQIAMFSFRYYPFQ
ncbi:MAG: coiled-coil domain-containing protein [Janthinobacterium lividum]